MAVGIVGYGAYIPRYRIKIDDIARAWGSRGRGERSVTGTDEDAITMAAEASLNAVQNSGRDPENEIDSISFGSCSSPYIEQGTMGLMKDVLDMKPEADTCEFLGSPRAATAAMKASANAIKAGKVKNSLVIAADCRSAEPGSDVEQTFGAGAGAMVLGTEGAIAEIEDEYSYSTAMVDRWRGSEDRFVRSYDYRYTREFGFLNHVTAAVEGLLKKTGTTIDQFQYVVLQEPDVRMKKEAARNLKVKKEQLTSSVVESIGDSGAAGILLGLISVLEIAKPGDRILMVSYGSGASDAISLKVTSEIDKKKGKTKPIDDYLKEKEYIDYVQYMKYTDQITQAGEKVNLNVPPVSPYIRRDSRDIYALIGAKCGKCGYINFPPSLRQICIRCGSLDLTPVKVGKRGKIYTYCINYYMPPPLEAPLPMLYVDLDTGLRYQGLGTDTKIDDIKIGSPVELVLRRVTVERGISIYGYKFRLLS